MAVSTGSSDDRQNLLVLRHGLRVDEVERDWVSTSSRPWDPPLAPQGLEQAGAAPASCRSGGYLWNEVCDFIVQAEAVVEELRSFNVQRIVASPFLRCVETAMAVLDGLHLPQNVLEYDWQICEVRKVSVAAMAYVHWSPSPGAIRLLGHRSSQGVF